MGIKEEEKIMKNKGKDSLTEKCDKIDKTMIMIIVKASNLILMN